MTGAHDLLLNLAPCGILSVTHDGTITYANAYCCKLLEFDPLQLTGRNVSDILTFAGKIFYQTHLYPLINLHAQAAEIFLNFKTSGKKDLPVVLNAVSQTLNSEQTIIFSFIPVFNRRKYEDEILLAKNKAEQALEKNQELERIKRNMEQQQEELDRQVSLLQFQNKELLKMSDVMAHDLQEPVRKVLFFSNELLKKEAGHGLNQNALSILNSSALKIKKLLLSLQTYISLKVDSYKPEQVNLHDVVQDELAKLRCMFSEIQVSFECDELVTISGIKSQLRLLFHHILKNAFEYGSINQTLSLSIQSVEIKENLFHSLENKFRYIDSVKITISDNGPGFSDSYNDYVFEVLKRLNTKGENMGFGLAFCKRITENHSGRLLADGNLGKGAIFTIILPININH